MKGERRSRNPDAVAEDRPIGSWVAVPLWKWYKWRLKVLVGEAVLWVKYLTYDIRDRFLPAAWAIFVKYFLAILLLASGSFLIFYFFKYDDLPFAFAGGFILTIGLVRIVIKVFEPSAVEQRRYG